MSMLATWGREGRAMNILMFQELEFRPSRQNRFSCENHHFDAQGSILRSWNTQIFIYVVLPIPQTEGR